MGRDEGNLIGDRKRQRGYAKEISLHLPQADRCLTSLQATTLEANPHLCSFFLYLQFSLLSMTLYGTDYPLDQFWLAVPVACPSSHLPTPCLLTAVEAERGVKENLDIVQTLLNNNRNTGVLSTLI